MGTIAKGEITLSPVNDAYTVLLTPVSCVINADYDGSNPKLQNAITTLIIKRGTKTVPFSILSISKSSAAIGVSYSSSQTTSASIKLLAISKSELGGWVDITFKTADGFDYTSTIRFNFTVVRETSMLDWILDWESSKTKVGSTYIMTPKLFVGHKESVVHAVEQEDADSFSTTYEWVEDALTGVYIGPDLLGDAQTIGLYGYYLSKEIFHLNADGGMIGGWDINEAGISSGNLKILSEGSIIAGTSTQTYWSLKADGNASFANGNVTFKPNGDASFKGTITSSKGSIGGWVIVPDQIRSGRIVLDSDQGLIGVYADFALDIEVLTGKIQVSKIPSNGGVTMYYTSGSDYGLLGYSSTARVFQLGSTNFIAGWSFDHQAIYTGTKNTTQHAFTEENSLTISPTGIRSNKWYIDSDGTAQFVGGAVKLNTDNAEMFGWTMKGDRFSTKHAALVSNSSDSGVYVSVADITNIASSSLRTTISNNGGIYMYSDGANALLRAYDTNGKLGFRLSTNGYHQIGSWNFDHESIYTGAKTLGEDGFTSITNAIILSINGLYGKKWKLLADGSGAIAGDNISWDSNGNVTLAESVSVSWSSVTGKPNLTKIDANGIYTGTISANNITAGTITTAAIKNGEYWALNTDGSGYLASKNIIWTADGTLNVVKGFIGGWELSYTHMGATVQIGSDADGVPTMSKSNYGMSLYDDFIVFNHQDGRQAILGTWDNMGQPMLARLINNKAGQWDLGPKIGIYFDISNSPLNKNYAFCGHGNGVLNGAIDGYAFERIALTSNNTIYNQFMNAAKANRYIVRSSATGSGATMPTLSQVRTLLGVGTTTPFCVRFTIISDLDSNDWTLYGRSNQKISDNTTPYNNESYPVIIHWDGGCWETISMGKGDSLEFMLVYDPNSTATVNSWPTKYTARLINKQS